MTHVLVASDKFKGSLTAAAVGEAVSAGIRGVCPNTKVVVVPVAASGPTGESVATCYAQRGDRAVVELADVSGLSQLSGGLAPLTASSRGTGEVIAAALDAGCRRIVLGIGGSASTDGGAGLVSALGGRLLDAGGGEIANGGAALEHIERLDLSGLHPRLADAEIVVACDVDNPLTGPHGAAAVYGAQKGASPDDVGRLDGALGRWADVVADATSSDHREAPGAGAAGGVGFAAIALLGAQLRPGIDLMLDLVDFHRRLAGARLVVTGEGSLDDQTLHGKAPAGVAAAARAAGIPVVAVCGRSLLTTEQLAAAGISAAYSLKDLEPDVQRSMTNAAPLLERLAGRIAVEHLAGSS